MPPHLPISVPSVGANQLRLRERLLDHCAEGDMTRGLRCGCLVAGAWSHIIDFVPELERKNLLVVLVDVTQYRCCIGRSVRGCPLVTFARATGFIESVRHPKHEVTFRSGGEAIEIVPVCKWGRRCISLVKMDKMATAVVSGGCYGWWRSPTYALRSDSQG